MRAFGPRAPPKLGRLKPWASPSGAKDFKLLAFCKGAQPSCKGFRSGSIMFRCDLVMVEELPPHGMRSRPQDMPLTRLVPGRRRETKCPETNARTL